MKEGLPSYCAEMASSDSLVQFADTGFRSDTAIEVLDGDSRARSNISVAYFFRGNNGCLACVPHCKRFEKCTPVHGWPRQPTTLSFSPTPLPKIVAIVLLLIYTPLCLPAPIQSVRSSFHLISTCVITTKNIEKLGIRSINNNGRLSARDQAVVSNKLLFLRRNIPKACRRIAAAGKWEWGGTATEAATAEQPEAER